MARDRSARSGARALQQHALRTVAAFEALKGVAAIIVLIGVVDLLHHDVQHLAIELIGRFGLAPGGHASSLLMHYAGLLPGANLGLIVALALGYVALRFCEAWGLWHARAWAEWLGALSGGIYVPFELQHWLRHPSAINAGVLIGNLLVVAFLAFQLWQRHERGTDQG
ncbi:MAG: hypothetical protein OJF60_000706 [Burkholderiaceae bacterium]|jgi:uncharacterized membrane protein (DUF2068 family)|nr:MAG: hypothetical protein OJF60_000706 [Burkholderiaceae bacterium]